jgi:glucose-1-phosphate adenylyltransferase
MPGDDTRVLASMGNYVFNTTTLVDIVTPGGELAAKDLGGDVIPALTASGVAHLYDFSTNVIPGQEEHERGYWRDVGTLDAYYWANMDLLGALPSFSLYNAEWPVYSLQLPLPPAKLSHGNDGSAASVDNSLICTGAIVSGARVERSIVGPDVRIESGSEVTESILLPGVRVASGVRLHRCIIDKNVNVPHGYRLGVEGGADPEQFARSDQGVIVVEKDRELG